MKNQTMIIIIIIIIIIILKKETKQQQQKDIEPCRNWHLVMGRWKKEKNRRKLKLGHRPFVAQMLL